MWMVPQELYARGVITQTGDVAWTFRDTMEILTHLQRTRNPFLVLGGDVLNGALEYTGDSWWFERDRGANGAANRDLCFEKAFSLMEKYKQREHKSCYFVLIIADLQTVGEMTRREVDKARIERMRQAGLRSRVMARVLALRGRLSRPGRC